MEISTIAYVAGGAAFGLMFGELIRPMRVLHLITGILAGLKKLKPKDQIQIVDNSTIIRCGACRSIITTRPIMRTVTDGKDTLIYRCQQCSSQVAVQTGN
jgi:hypothetical protein